MKAEAVCVQCGESLSVGDRVYPGLGRVWCDRKECRRGVPAIVQPGGGMCWEDDGSPASFQIEIGDTEE